MVNERQTMKDDNGKRITLVHDRFQVCCTVCHFVSGHQRKQDAIEAAKRHSCEDVEVWDAMARNKDNDVVWRKNTKATELV